MNQTRIGQQHVNISENQGDALVEQATELQAEQMSIIDTQLESRYSTELAVIIEDKHEQVEHIEEKLDDLIELQISRLQQIKSQEPGILAMPGSRLKWQQKMQRVDNTMQRLNNRLELVREIKEGMGIHGQKIEELAFNKLRHKDPILVGQWEDMQEARRRHQALSRKKLNNVLEKTQNRGAGLGLSWLQS